MSEIKVLASTALKPTLDEVLPDFERDGRHTVKPSYAPSAQIAKKIERGESCDVIIATGPQFDELIGLGKAIAGSRKDIASSVIGVAVREDVAKPDISTAEHFKRAMLAARSIATSNPDGGGASGAHLAKVFETLGIADAIRPKLIYGPGGPHGLIGNYLRSGQADIGLQQIPELMAVPGIRIVGALPAALQMVLLFSVGLARDAQDADAAAALVAFLSGPRVAAVLKDKGMNTLQRGDTADGSLAAAPEGTSQ